MNNRLLVKVVFLLIILSCVCVLRAEGGCVSHIKPDHLLDVNEYKCWLEQMKKHKDVEESSGYKKTEIECVDTPKIPFRLFPLVSKKAWLDCLLQLLKSCVVNRITLKTFKNSPVPYNKEESFPDIKPDPLISNVNIKHDFQRNDIND